MKLNSLLIIATCLGLASCAPIEHLAAKEGATAPPYKRRPEDITWRAEKHDDTNHPTSYKNHRQYPPRRYKNDNSHKPSRGM